MGHDVLRAALSLIKGRDVEDPAMSMKAHVPGHADVRAMGSEGSAFKCGY